MAHTNYTIPTSVWSISSGNLVNSTLFSFNTPCYIINPTTLNNLGLTYNSSLSEAQFQNLKSTLSSPVSFEASDYLISNWISCGWGSNASEVLANYNSFVNNHLELGGSLREQLNKASIPLTSVVTLGELSSSNYFLPILVFSNQTDADPLAGNSGQNNSMVAVQSISISSPVESNIMLSHDNPVENAGSYKYEVYRSLLGNPSLERSFTVSGYFDDPISNTVNVYGGGDYYIKVYPLTFPDTLGSSTTSNTIYVDSSLPSKPTIFSAIWDGTGISLNWSSAFYPDLTAFNIYRDNVLIATINEPAFDTTYLDTTAEEFGSYYYEVEASVNFAVEKSDLFYYPTL